jgi:hypothetical protein
MTRTVTRVKVNAASSGSGVYEVADLDLGPIDVLGTYLEVHADKSYTPCFLVLTTKGTLLPKAMRLFEVLDFE